MNLNTLSQGEPWMTPEERTLNHEFVHATTRFLEARNVAESPLITIRVNDVIATWLLARRLETALTPAEGEPAPCPTTAQAGAIGKCRDRLRRAMKELEACCPRDTAADGQGLLERMQQAAAQHLEPAPGDHTPQTCDPSETGGHVHAAADNPDPAEKVPAPPHLPPSDAPVTQSNAPGGRSKPSARGITAQSTSDQPNSRDARPAPTQAEPVPSPPPEAPRSGKRTTAKKRRKKRGIPIRPRRC